MTSPLIRWMPVRKRRRPHLKRVFFAGGLAIGLLALPHPRPLVIYNASASAPLGFYRVASADALHRGDLVLAPTPLPVRHLAAARGYLPATVPLVKRIAAMGGDHVCVVDHTLLIDHRPVARQLTRDRLGRPLPLWVGCRRLDSSEVFLLMADVPASFDGRYFGPVQHGAIIGRLVPLWLR